MEDIDDVVDSLLLDLALELEFCYTPIQTGQPGQEYVKELLGSAHPERIRQVLRMQLPTFYALRDWLLDNTSLRGDNIELNRRVRGYGRQVSIEEKLMIFLHIVSRTASNRDTRERFSRSGNTVSR
jgi:hypothetical protein